jgi:hypothetical protein
LQFNNVFNQFISCISLKTNKNSKCNAFYAPLMVIIVYCTPRLRCLRCLASCNKRRKREEESGGKRARFWDFPASQAKARRGRRFSLTQAGK